METVAKYRVLVIPIGVCVCLCTVCVCACAFAVYSGNCMSHVSVHCVMCRVHCCMCVCVCVCLCVCVSVFGDILRKR